MVPSTPRLTPAQDPAVLPHPGSVLRLFSLVCAPTPSEVSFSLMAVPPAEAVGDLGPTCPVAYQAFPLAPVKGISTFICPKWNFSLFISSWLH